MGVSVSRGQGQVQKIVDPANCQPPTAKPTIYLAPHPRGLLYVSFLLFLNCHQPRYTNPPHKRNKLYSDIEQVEIWNDSMKIIYKYPKEAIDQDSNYTILHNSAEQARFCGCLRFLSLGQGVGTPSKVLLVSRLVSKHCADIETCRLRERKESCHTIEALGNRWWHFGQGVVG